MQELKDLLDIMAVDEPSIRSTHPCKPGGSYARLPSQGVDDQTRIVTERPEPRGPGIGGGLLPGVLRKGQAVFLDLRGMRKIGETDPFHVRIEHGPKFRDLAGIGGRHKDRSPESSYLFRPIGSSVRHGHHDRPKASLFNPPHKKVGPYKTAPLSIHTISPPYGLRHNLNASMLHEVVHVHQLHPQAVAIQLSAGDFCFHVKEPSSRYSNQ